MPKSATVTLTVTGRRFDGWKDIMVEQRLDALCGSFDLGMTERWPGQSENWRIEAGDACSVAVDGETLLTGWVDRARYQLNPKEHPLRVQGRDRTCDLVDCSAEHQPGSWLNRTIDQIARDLVAPFGLKVTMIGSPGAVFQRFALEPGETVLDAIQRMTVLRGLLATTDAQGDLVLQRPSEQVAGYRLVEGENIEDVVFDNDTTDRFSRVRILGHDASDESAGSRAARPKAEALDAGVRRHRPLVIVADEEATTATLDASAKWEVSVRSAKAQGVTVVASGWRAPDGQLYRPNLVVPVAAPTLGLDAELLVAGVRFRRSAHEGSRTELSLVRKEAYSLKPVAAQAGRRSAAAPPAGR